ncbi:alpha/beta hydrolase [soil metagenome]
MNSALRARTFSLPDGDVAAWEAGDPARPIDIVFLHANGFNARTYAPILTAMGAAGRRIVAIDQRGHGKTRLPADPEGRIDWHGFRDDFVQLADHIGLTAPVVLSGHSMGGTAMLLSAPDLGDRVRSLVLFDPVLARPPEMTGEQRAATLRPLVDGALRRRRLFPSRGAAIAAYVDRGAFKTWPRETIAAYVEDGFADVDDGVTLTCAPEWEASNFAAQGSDYWTALERLTRPLTILRAEHGSTCMLTPDHPTIAGHADRSVTTVAGASHFLPMERPELVVEALLKASA